MSDHWDAILASAPLNATAATVTGKGTGFQPEEAFKEHAWETVPSLLKLAHPLSTQASFVDLTGRIVGRLRVLGMAADIPGIWVCRCACGRYVGRKSGPLKRGATTTCDACNYTQKLRYYSSGDRARERAESPEAQKWQPAAITQSGK